MVVDYLCDRVMEPDMAVACFYYDFASREAQSPTNMLGSLLKQLLSGLGAIPMEVAQKFRSQKKAIGGRRLQLPDIVKMCTAVSSLQRTFICVDALDECVPRDRLEVLDALEQILRGSSNTRMFMTGRSHIQGVVERGLGGRTISVSIRSKENDIITYLRVRLRKDTTPEAMNSFLENDIMNSILEDISETYVPAGDPGNSSESYTNKCKYRFLLASLKIETILREATIHQRRNRLNAVRDGLGLEDAYEATLERVRAQEGGKPKLALTALMWICYSERPLRLEELCHALAVEIGSTLFNNDNVPGTETLLACCQGLVTVDKEASTFRLIHHTLREHLCTDRNLFPRAHMEMAETCLTYLNSVQTEALLAKPQPDLSSMPFLKYCSRYWGIHANRELSDCAVLLAMELLGQYENHVAANSLFEQILDPSDSREANTPLFGGLHCVSFFGIVEVMTSLLEMSGCDANKGDSAGITPLTWAVRGGQEEAVELLLRQEAINPDKPDNRDKTPLSWAAIKGYESVVKQLLDRQDVNPDKPDNEGNTPLSWAAIKGHESVVKQLLDRQDVNPDKPDNEGNTPLSYAAINGHEPVVKQFLDRKDVSPDKPDNEDKTPLWWAAFGGYALVVKQLLDRQDVNPDKPDTLGRTPLSQAATKGHELVVKLLLNRQDVNPDKPDSKGHTPLVHAAFSGHQLVVKRLLGRQDVNPDKPDNAGNAPLLLSAMKGHELVVKQFLDREDVDPDKPGDEGRTPLWWAGSEGHELVVKRLLDRGDVNPDKPDNSGVTPLAEAAAGGHEQVVKQLLDREDVNPNKPDNEDKTPLWWAAMKGHESVVKQLLDREDVNPAEPDKNGHIPLWHASRNGHEGVVNLLQAWQPQIPAWFAVNELQASLPSSL